MIRKIYKVGLVLGLLLSIPSLFAKEQLKDGLNINKDGTMVYLDGGKKYAVPEASDTEKWGNILQTHFEKNSETRSREENAKVLEAIFSTAIAGAKTNRDLYNFLETATHCLGPIWVIHYPITAETINLVNKVQRLRIEEKQIADMVSFQAAGMMNIILTGLVTWTPIEKIEIYTAAASQRGGLMGSEEGITQEKALEELSAMSQNKRLSVGVRKAAADALKKAKRMNLGLTATRKVLAGVHVVGGGPPVTDGAESAHPKGGVNVGKVVREGSKGSKRQPGHR